MMATMVLVLPRRHLAAGGPLPFHVPAPDLGGIGRVLEVEDDDDVAQVAFHFGRQVGIATVEIETVDARSATGPESDLARLGRVGHVVDLEPAHEVGRRLAGIDDGFRIADHQPTLHAHLVRMRVGLLDGQFGDDPRLGGIAHIDDGGAFGPHRVANVGDGAVHDDLAASLAVQVADAA
jgi:hypothetical protein